MHVICSGQYNFFSVCEVINPISKMAALGRSRIHLHSIPGSSLVQCKHTCYSTWKYFHRIQMNKIAFVSIRLLQSHIPNS